MGSQHVDRLFSDAYDSMLSNADRTRFDEHVDTCAQCRVAYDDYRVALTAVSELPRARMPVPVVLPASLPQVEAGAASRLRALLQGLLKPQGMAGAAALAAVGVAAVVVVVHSRGDGTTTSPAALGNLQSHGADSLSIPQGGGLPLVAPNVLAPAACSGTIGLPSPAGSPAIPGDFANRVVHTDPSRPGESLILATQQQNYAPGSQVVIYARAVSSATDASVANTFLPCVSLVDPAKSSIAHAGSPAPGGAAFSDTSAIVEAVPTTLGSSTTAPLLTVTIPANTPRGTTLHLVARVPPGVPASADTALFTVELTITVT